MSFVIGQNQPIVLGPGWGVSVNGSRSAGGGGRGGSGSNVSNTASNSRAISAPSVSNYSIPARSYRANISSDDSRTPNGSANNRMSERSNRPRFNGRIPDIYGKVRSVPDLLAETYVVYKDNVAVEIAYMCVGRGEYELTDFRDGPIAFDSISSAKYDVYGPYTSPATDYGTVGEPFLCVTKSDLGRNTELPATNYEPEDESSRDPDKVVGPVIFNNVDGILLNFTVNESDDIEDIVFDIDVFIQYQQVDADDNGFGPIHTEIFRIPGSVDAIGISKKSNLPFAGKIQVWISRNTPYHSSETNNNHKILRLREVYGILQIDATDFGNITTIRTSVEPYERADAGGTRKFTCLATRKIDGVATSKFADIAKAICIDPTIGNRQLNEVDVAGLNALQAEIEAYFGTPLAAEFNYTFDDLETSFEEALNTVCRAVFVTPYRIGPLIKFSFERETDKSRLLFNHRNKVPGTESRTINFGYLDEKDGIAYEYTDTEDGAILNLYLPEDQSAINIESNGPVGITNKLQLYFHAKRQFARQRYQNTLVEFNATQEANLLTINDRILVSDNTRLETYDGEIVSKNGLLLTLSQPFYFPAGSTASIFIQNILGEVEARDISETSNPYQVLLSAELSGNLSLSEAAYTRAIYEIAVSGRDRREAFLVLEKSPDDAMQVQITAVNYDDRYYAADKDFINGLVTEKGNPVL